MLVLVQQVILPEMRGRFRRWFTSLKPLYLPCTFSETFFVSLALGPWARSLSHLNCQLPPRWGVGPFLALVEGSQMVFPKGFPSSLRFF